MAEEKYRSRVSTADEMSEPISSDGLPLREVHGDVSEKLVEEEIRSKESIRYYFYPTWRSQCIPLIAFSIVSVICIVLSQKFSALVIRGPLFSFGETALYLDFPILIIFPFAILVRIFMKMYDARYSIDKDGVEAQVGLVSLKLRQPKLRWEDIRGVEPIQTLWERLLGIGSVLVGSSMTNEVEIVMEGVANPRAIQLLIGAERSKRIKELREGGSLAEKVGVLNTD